MVAEGKRPEAEEQLQKAAAIGEKLTAEFPTVPGYRPTQSSSSLNSLWVTIISDRTARSTPFWCW
jgi:hypothetical protein